MLTQEICDPLDRTREGAKQMFSFDVLPNAHI